MTFDPTALQGAFQANRQAAESANNRLADRHDLADAGMQAAAAELGLDREQANALMAEALRACVGDPTADPQEIRKNPVLCWIAIGMVYGYLAALRLYLEANT